VVPAERVGLRGSLAGDHGLRLVDVDAADRERFGRVTRFVDAPAGIRHRLIGAVAAQRSTGYGSGSDAGLHAALIGARERDGDVFVVPAGRVRRRRTAAGDCGSRLVDVDAADRRGVGAVAGFVGAAAAVRDGLVLAFGADRASGNGVGG